MATSNQKGKHGSFITRPGVESASRLRDVTDVSVWESIESNYYQAMLKAKGGAKLCELDQALQELGRKVLAQQEDAAITKDDLLETVIPWKFSKGKNRPALWGQLRGNTNSEVENASRNAFEKARSKDGDLLDAISSFCKLRGVGPATASAVLCRYKPSKFSFMDDEVIEALITDKKRGYTPKIYKEMNDRCIVIAKKLNVCDSLDDASTWTPARVGCALWTAAQMSIYSKKELEAAFERSGTSLNKNNDGRDGEEQVVVDDDVKDDEGLNSTKSAIPSDRLRRSKRRRQNR